MRIVHRFSTHISSWAAVESVSIQDQLIAVFLTYKACKAARACNVEPICSEERLLVRVFCRTKKEQVPE
jgi:hypothetical protein